MVPGYYHRTGCNYALLTIRVWTHNCVPIEWYFRIDTIEEKLGIKS